MLGNNFGLLGGFKRGRQILKQLHRITAGDGLIIAATMDPYQTSNPEHRQYHRRNRRRGRMGGQIRMRVRFGRSIGAWFDYLFVSPEEMEQILSGTGWEVRELLRSDGPNYIAIIGKSASGPGPPVGTGPD
jgi:hypothetical protein